jgi:hypothetical protein
MKENKRKGQRKENQHELNWSAMLPQFTSLRECRIHSET